MFAMFAYFFRNIHIAIVRGYLDDANKAYSDYNDWRNRQSDWNVNTALLLLRDIHRHENCLNRLING